MTIEPVAQLSETIKKDLELALQDQFKKAMYGYLQDIITVVNEEHHIDSVKPVDIIYYTPHRAPALAAIKEIIISRWLTEFGQRTQPVGLAIEGYHGLLPLEMADYDKYRTKFVTMAMKSDLIDRIGFNVVGSYARNTQCLFGANIWQNGENMNKFMTGVPLKDRWKYLATPKTVFAYICNKMPK